MTELKAEQTQEARKLTGAQQPKHQTAPNSEERRFQDALEDDEVRENLKNLRAAKAST